MFGILQDDKKMEDPLRMNEIVLAYLGDCVYELYVRNQSVLTGSTRVNILNKMSSEKAKASYQAEALKRIEPFLDETEKMLIKRTKNKKTTSKPKNAEIGDYKAATAFEALVGYLYLIEDRERMEFVIKGAIKNDIAEIEEEKGEAGNE